MGNPTAKYSDNFSHRREKYYCILFQRKYIKFKRNFFLVPDWKPWGRGARNLAPRLFKLDTLSRYFHFINRAIRLQQITRCKIYLRGIITVNVSSNIAKPLCGFTRMVYLNTNRIEFDGWTAEAMLLFINQ